MLDLALEKLQACIKKRILHFSPIRESVLKEIVASDKALCSEEIYKRVAEKSQKKVSFNTVYRVLRLLEACEIVRIIQSDFKRTHYALATCECHIYTLHKNSNDLMPMENSSASQQLLKEHQLENTKSFIVIHKV